ncbi:hypothetical protein V8C40DRAFT_254307 [Trichoderma camerunense]
MIIKDQSHFLKTWQLLQFLFLNYFWLVFVKHFFFSPCRLVHIHTVTIHYAAWLAPWYNNKAKANKYMKWSSEYNRFHASPQHHRVGEGEE